MKKRWLVALVICMYAIQAVYAALCFVPEDNSDYELAVNICTGLILLLTALALVFVAINIASAVRHFGKGLLNNDQQNTFSRVLQFKLVLIPYYILNFALWLLIAVFSLVLPVFLMIGWLLLIATLLVSVFTYITILATSVWAIAQIVALRKQNALSKVECILHIVAQLIFVVDVADTVYLNYKFKMPLDQQ